MGETDVEQVTLALLDAANDKDFEVQAQVRKSMLTLGNEQPDRVLAMCQDYLLKHPKLVVSHRVVILQTIELIVSSRIDAISYPRIKSIISLASDEMTRSKEVVPDWQQAASNILVAVGNKHINDTMEEILSKFQPGILPHFFVVQTLANLSDSNVYGMVPFLNAILGTMLPMLSLTKQDNMKWVFSSALCHFSDSISEYLANLDKAPDPTVRQDTFSSEICAAFDILFNNWLQSRESKLRLTVAEAVGSMCHLMASDKLEEHIPKLIPAILSLYKKTNEHYIISKSLCHVLDASVNMGSRVLETQLDSLLFALHQQVSTSVDYSNPPTVKNHNEVLRCFSLLAKAFPDRLVMFVLQRLENSNERSRLGSLAVLRHLINSSSESSMMESKKLLILASIRQPMADHSNKVKKRVVQVISAMAHHGYLELDGGELLVRFLVQHCALPDTYQKAAADPEEVTNESLRTMCDSTLHLLTTTVGRLADVLWPKLLYYMSPPQYSNATTPLCKSLIVLGNKKKDNKEASFNIDFSQEVNLPSPQALMVKLLVNAAFPFNSRGHGAPSLSLLQILSVNIHRNLEAVWDQEIPPLLTVLEESTAESFDKISWDESLLKFLSKTLVAVDDDKWLCHFATEATTYLSTYNNALEEKSFLYQCIGVTLQHSFNKDFVKKQLQEILLTARHNDALERQGVALAIGLCANSHLEGTLAKLDEFGKSDAFKKSPSIFNLLKDRNDVELEKVKSTLILCYGQVAVHAPPEKILNRIDQDILGCISKHFNTKVLGIKVETKDLTMKLSLIQSVGLVAKAISACVKKQGYVFSRKQELIALIQDFIKAEPADGLRTSVRHLVMRTCAHLIPLDPALSENETFDLLKVCVSSVFSLPPETHTPEKMTKDEEVLDPKQRKALYKDTLSSLHELLSSVLGKEPTPDALQSVFKHVECGLTSTLDHERERAISATAHLLNHYLDNMTVKNMMSFHNLGALLGRLSPRCSDPQLVVRATAIDCVYLLLYIQLRYEGFALDYKDGAVEGLLPLKSQLENPDHSVLYKTCFELTKVMSKRLPQQQMTTLVFMLFEGLVDSQTNCCRASSVILNTLLKNRGGGLQEMVPEMLEMLHVRLQSITEEQVRVAVGQTVLIMASQHLQTVLNTLANQPLPYDSWTSEMWMALGADPIVAHQIIEIVMEKLAVMAPYVDKKESMIRGGTTKVATNKPLAMTCGLKELLLNGQSQEPALSKFSQLFSCLLVRLASSVGVSAPKDNATKRSAAIHVAGVAADALRILLARAQLDEVLKRLDEEKAWDAIKEQNAHITGVTLLARAMAKHAGPRLPAIVECLCPSLNNIYECQRITVTAFFSELLNHHVATELMFIDVLMNNMMERIADPCCTVRMLAVRGLGNIAVGSPEKVNKYAKELLAAMSSGMEEKDDPGKLIILEAMSGLSKVLLYLDKKNVHLLVVYIFMKIKPFLESDNDDIRCASIHLMGKLSKFGSGEPIFKDQIHNVLVSLLLHLVDPNAHVVKACKYAMRVCAPMVGSEQITAMFQNHLHEDKSLHYGEFINDLTKYLIQDFPGMLNFYHISVLQFFKSNWSEVRAGAAMFIGFLLGNLPEEHYAHLNMGTITQGLVMLLQDPDPVVRVKAAEAMGRFH
ncbi:maestro heat-like repeat-containing protein family member 1 isoform X1 [Syngnathus scovelli]|uniref:maestro heat-like repeat-containing protein family member 1 isoform X1 n=1 Tax=Syngnathus scovelli TaxID=161590 RepID=UPI00210F9D6B|nr:maestro heat-like repeat-containing protein family member 1 isoform X1 [Syngnathus scovelli]